ncbi:MAG: hypothetical protein NT013_30660 [Planctomycetia bacterium]|nr:hypothetical protein [Planctomycetia bacterium]
MTTRHRIRPNALAEEKKLRDELEQQPISFDLALALRHHIETVRRDAENGNGKIDEDMERAKRRAEINGLLLDILEKITTPIADE